MEILENIVWGVIGAGDVCEKKSAPAMNKIQHSKIKTVMRRTASKAKDFAERHHIDHWSDQPDDIFNDSEINAVYIATPPNAHASLAIQAAKAGKAAYVEKPMARTYEECKSMVDVFERVNLPLFVAYYRRALPNFLKIKELVERGKIGEVRLVNIELYQSADPNLVRSAEDNWRVNPEISGGGYFHDLASHQLDYLDFLLGPVQSVAGFSTNQAGLYEADDVVTGSFTFKNGVTGSGSWCFTTGKSSEKDLTTIVGSKGQIEFSYFANSDVYLDSRESGKQKFSFEKPEHIQQPLIQWVVDDLRGKGKCPSTGVTGARTNWVMDQICNSF